MNSRGNSGGSWKLPTSISARLVVFAAWALQLTTYRLWNRCRTPGYDQSGISGHKVSARDKTHAKKENYARIGAGQSY